MLPKPANFDTKDQKSSSSSSNSPDGMNNDKIIAKPQDLGLRYDAGRKAVEEDEGSAGPVIQGGEDSDPITRYACALERCIQTVLSSGSGGRK